jgi:hypothetical protein
MNVLKLRLFASANISMTTGYSPPTLFRSLELLICCCLRLDGLTGCGCFDKRPGAFFSGVASLLRIPRLNKTLPSDNATLLTACHSAINLSPIPHANTI